MDDIYEPIDAPDVSGIHVLCSVCGRDGYINVQSVNRLIQTCSRGQKCPLLDSISDIFQPYHEQS